MPTARFRASILVVPLLVACSVAGGPSGAPSPSPSPAAPTPFPSPTTVAEFTLEVVPAEEPTAIRMAIPGEKVCLLVVVRDAGTAGPVTVAATASNASVLKIDPEQLPAGRVGEVWVVPAASTVEATASVTITASRGGVTRTATRTIPIFPMVDQRAADARPHFERWVAWLASAHPELGIGASTKWEPQFVSTLLVVSHYAYWSDEWEMTVAWHNMIPPYDWSDVFLRRRGTDLAPSLAFRIDSVSGRAEQHAVVPPEVVVR